MAKKTIQVNIPEPCHEDWNKMTTTQCGAFCKACSKEVIDFTNKSVAQIVEILSQAKGKVCGRFTTDKLDKPLVKFEPDPEWYSWKKWAIAAGVLLGVGYVSADVIDQNPKPNTDMGQPVTTTHTLEAPAYAEHQKQLPHIQVTRPLADSTYGNMRCLDTFNIGTKQPCMRPVNPSVGAFNVFTDTVGVVATGIDVEELFPVVEDTVIKPIDTVVTPSRTWAGEIVVMGKIAAPQKDKKPKKDR
ncbi:MAG: hypothetical protein JST49_01765 [Bacteroidetes bacterium]|nr:hypothetical protein [Bacteroidota bacterium]